MNFEAIFPPRDEWDVAAYSTEEVVSGYRQHRLSDLPPGDNRDPGYRWGWVNARKDATRIEDGFESVRSAYIAMERLKN